MKPIFENPMPLYVTYDTAVQYETPTASPFPYLDMTIGPEASEVPLPYTAGDSYSTPSGYPSGDTPLLQDRHWNEDYGSSRYQV